jgi:hypothetical protein
MAELESGAYFEGWWACDCKEERAFDDESWAPTMDALFVEAAGFFSPRTSPWPLRLMVGFWVLWIWRKGISRADAGGWRSASWLSRFLHE